MIEKNEFEIQDSYGHAILVYYTEGHTGTKECSISEKIQEWKKVKSFYN